MKKINLLLMLSLFGMTAFAADSASPSRSLGSGSAASFPMDDSRNDSSVLDEVERRFEELADRAGELSMLNPFVFDDNETPTGSFLVSEKRGVQEEPMRIEDLDGFDGLDASAIDEESDSEEEQEKEEAEKAYRLNRLVKNARSIRNAMPLQGLDSSAREPVKDARNLKISGNRASAETRIAELDRLAGFMDRCFAAFEKQEAEIRAREEKSQRRAASARQRVSDRRKARRKELERIDVQRKQAAAAQAKRATEGKLLFRSGDAGSLEGERGRNLLQSGGRSPELARQSRREGKESKSGGGRRSSLEGERGRNLLRSGGNSPEPARRFRREREGKESKSGGGSARGGRRSRRGREGKEGK